MFNYHPNAMMHPEDYSHILQVSTEKAPDREHLSRKTIISDADGSLFLIWRCWYYTAPFTVPPAFLSSHRAPCSRLFVLPQVIDGKDSNTQHLR